MSQGPNRERKSHKMAPKQRAGMGKPASEGLSFLPPLAYEPLREILDEHGLRGLPVLLSLYRLSGTEIERCDVKGTSLILHGPDGSEQARWPLDKRLVGAVSATLRTLKASKGRLSDLLSKTVTRKLRRRMVSAHPWVVHLRITVGLMHRLGDAAAVDALRDRPDQLRAWRRSPWASAQEIEPLTTEAVASAYDEAEAPFWQRIDGLMSDDDRRVLASLSKEQGP
jgi:hypothetical protein